MNVNLRDRIKAFLGEHLHMPQVSNVISSSLNYKTSQKSGRVETNDSYLATISEEKTQPNEFTLNSTSIVWA